MLEFANCFWITSRHDPIILSLQSTVVWFPSRYRVSGWSGVQRTSPQTTQWVRDWDNSPVPSSLIFLSVSESTELVSLPRCKHHTEQENNEAAYLEKTCFPAECHYMSLFMHLNSLFLRLTARKTDKRMTVKWPTYRVLVHIFTDKISPPKSQVRA